MRSEDFGNYLPMLAAKVLPDGTYMLAMGVGRSVVLMHYVVRHFTINWNNPRPNPYDTDWMFFGRKPEFEPQFEPALINTAIIPREEFEAGGYENKVYEREPSQVARQALLAGPEG